MPPRRAPARCAVINIHVGSDCVFSWLFPGTFFVVARGEKKLSGPSRHRWYVFLCVSYLPTPRHHGCRMRLHMYILRRVYFSLPSICSCLCGVSRCRRDAPSSRNTEPEPITFAGIRLPTGGARCCRPARLIRSPPYPVGSSGLGVG